MRMHAGRALWILIMVMVLSVTYIAGSVMIAGKAAPLNRQTAKVQVEKEIPRVKTLENGEAQQDKMQNAIDSSDRIQAERMSSTYVYYYRIFNGWLQRRLWNRTRGEWAWSTWHDVKKVR